MKTRALFQLFLLSLLATRLQAAEINIIEPEAVGFSSYRLGKVTEFVEREIADGNLVGTVTLVARHGQVVHFEAAGRYGLEDDRPMENDALFRIFSMTKPLTCIAGLVCYEMGCFQLDDPVSLYLPEFSEHDDPAAPLTIEHCFTHTNGLQDTTGNTPTNLADLMTKHLPEAAMLAHLEAAGCEFREGRPEGAPHLEDDGDARGGPSRRPVGETLKQAQ